MEDYKEIIKEMLLRDFSTRPIDTKKALKEALFMTTIEVLQMVQGIIPSKPIDEHDVFEVLKETGFSYGIDEEDPKYVWFLFKKESNFVI